jgi:hypothetical protein
MFDQNKFLEKTLKILMGFDSDALISYFIKNYNINEGYEILNFGSKFKRVIKNLEKVEKGSGEKMETISLDLSNGRTIYVNKSGTLTTRELLTVKSGIVLGLNPNPAEGVNSLKVSETSTETVIANSTGILFVQKSSDVQELNGGDFSGKVIAAWKNGNGLTFDYYNLQTIDLSKKAHLKEYISPDKSKVSPIQNPERIHEKYYAFLKETFAESKAKAK